MEGSDANTHHVDADPNLSFQSDADLEPTFHFAADPDPTCHFDADPDPDPAHHPIDFNQRLLVYRPSASMAPV